MSCRAISIPNSRYATFITGMRKMDAFRTSRHLDHRIDLTTDRIVKTIQFPPDVVLPTTYLNDIRFDLRKGQDGVAYITDSSDKGANGIIVVDLATGRSRRRLHDHPSTKAEPNFLPFVESQAMMLRRVGRPPQYLRTGVGRGTLEQFGRDRR